MPLASSCSMRWNRRSEPLRSTRTEIAGYLVSKPRATFSATGRSTDVYQTTLASFCAAAIRAGSIAVAGTASASETRGASEAAASAADFFSKLLRDSGLRISGYRAVYCKIEDMEVPQAAACGACRIGLIERIIQDEWDATLRNAAVGSQGMAIERGEVVGRRRRPDAGRGIAYHDHVPFTID